MFFLIFQATIDGIRYSCDCHSFAASGVGVSCSLSDWVSRPVEALAIPKQPASLTNATFADHLDKSVSCYAMVFSALSVFC